MKYLDIDRLQRCLNCNQEDSFLSCQAYHFWQQHLKDAPNILDILNNSPQIRQHLSLMRHCYNAEYNKWADELSLKIISDIPVSAINDEIHGKRQLTCLD